MRLLLNGLKGLTQLLLLAVVLVGWWSGSAVAGGFTGSGGGSGGFTGRPLITVEVSADKARLPLNLVGMGPDPTLPYTTTITAVVRQDGRLFPAEKVTIDMVGIGQDGLYSQGTLYYLQDNNDQNSQAPSPECVVLPDLPPACRQLVYAGTSGIVRSLFTSGSQTGTVTIVASAQDPNTKQVVSSETTINVVDERPVGDRNPTSMTFTGPYVDAVIAGKSRFENPALLDGSYSRVIGVLVNDINGNPTTPNTRVDFYLIDGPITGYPNNPGSFFIAGNNGNPQENAFLLNAPNGNFITRQVRPLEHLVLDGRQLVPLPDRPLPNNQFLTGIRSIDRVIDENNLTTRNVPTQSNGRSFNAGQDNGATVPYIIGRAEHGAILASGFTNVKGVASTLLTYPVSRIGQTAILVACVNDPEHVNEQQLCGILNTCDANGANCKSVYLGATNGSDWVLTTSATELGPNTTTPVKLCLKDPNFTPLAATAIRYDMSTTGVATVKVNGVEGKQGQVLTGEDGCATVSIQSSGQPPGSKDIVLSFIADNMPTASAVKVTIKAPGKGKIDGSATCQVTNAGSNKGDPPTPPTATCNVQMQLVDDNFSPLAGVLVTVGDGAAPDGGVFSVVFSPAEGNFGKTDDKGALAATVNFTGAGAFTIPFKALNGTAAYTLKFNVPKPTDKADDDTSDLAIKTTTLADGTVGTFYTALLQATGGKTPYSWSLQSGVLPGGIGLDSSTGVLSGTPTAPGTFNFVVQVKDAASRSALAALTLVVKQSGGGGNATASQLILLTSSPELLSSDQTPVTLTAIAKNPGGVLLADVAVAFQIKSGDGTIQVVRSITDETGTASALLSAGGNKRNRDIVLGATSGTVTASDLTVHVTGTTLNITGAPATVQKGDTIKLSLSLKDSSERAIADAALTVTSQLNGLAAAPGTSTALGSQVSVTTNTSGVAEVNLTVNQTGADTVDAAWDGVFTDPRYARSTTLPLTVNASPDSFVIEVLDSASGNPLTNVPLNTPAQVRVTWKQNNVAVSGATVKLTTTKGVFNPSDAGSNGTAFTGVTNAQGLITGLTVQSTVPGGAVLAATGSLGTGTVTASKSFQFVAVTAATLLLQANPSTIGVNTPPSTTQQSTLVATLRDVNDNPVADQEVFFTVTKDTSGGALSAASAKTDLTGQASVVYVAGSSPADQDGVIVQATTAGGLTATANITVSRREVFITLGTGNTITEPDPTTYALPYNVLVNDVAGGAVKGAVVTLDVVPLRYFKGYYRWNGTVWVPIINEACDNEDTNHSGILDPGEDINANGHLDPANVVTTSVSAVTTDADGFSKFDVLYAQQYANWISTDLSARTKVGGSEDQQSSIFILPASAEDLGDEKKSPPGNPSPFGVLPGCTISVSDEASLKMVTDPQTTLSIAVGSSSLVPSASVSGSVKVTLGGLKGNPDLTGASVASGESSIIPIISIAVPDTVSTTGSTALFSVTVSNNSDTVVLPVPAAGINVGTVTFVIGQAKAVVAINLTP